MSAAPLVALRKAKIGLHDPAGRVVGMIQSQLERSASHIIKANENVY